MNQTYKKIEIVVTKTSSPVFSYLEKLSIYPFHPPLPRETAELKWVEKKKK